MSPLQFRDAMLSKLCMAPASYLRGPACRRIVAKAARQLRRDLDRETARDFVFRYYTLLVIE